MNKSIDQLLRKLSKKKQPSNLTAGIELGEQANIFSPRRIDGAIYIRIGARSRIMPNAWLGAFDHYAGQTYKPEIIVGDDVYIGMYACITCVLPLKIGEGCVLSEFVYVSDHTHGFNPEKGLILRQPLETKGPISIGDHCFIGYHASILPGASLGCHCVVGSNSVLTHSFPDYSMVAGAPARLIKHYSLEEHAWITV